MNKTTMMMAVAAFALAIGNARADQVDQQCIYWMNELRPPIASGNATGNRYESATSFAHYAMQLRENALLKVKEGVGPHGEKQIEISEAASCAVPDEHYFELDGRGHTLTTYHTDYYTKLIRIDPARGRALAQYCALNRLSLGYQTMMVTVKASNGAWTALVRKSDYPNAQAISQQMNALVPVILPAKRNP